MAQCFSGRTVEGRVVRPCASRTSVTGTPCLPVVPGRGVEREPTLHDAGARSGGSAAPADYGARVEGTTGAGPGVRARGGRSDLVFG
ncbi:MAG: hypothetical protein WB608_18965, partial [Terracidiphilus sp.]